MDFDKFRTKPKSLTNLVKKYALTDIVKVGSADICPSRCLYKRCSDQVAFCFMSAHLPEKLLLRDRPSKRKEIIDKEQHYTCSLKPSHFRPCRKLWSLRLMARKTSILGMITLVAIALLMITWTQQLLADSPSAPLPLPISVNFDNGAPGWRSAIGWNLSEEYRFGNSGMGWGTTKRSSVSFLLWETQIDLRQANRPRLRFASQVSQLNQLMHVRVMVDEDTNTYIPIPLQPSTGVWTEITIDLSPYRGHRIELLWKLSGSTGSWMIDNVRVDDVAPTPIATRTQIIPTRTPFMPTVTFPPFTPAPTFTTTP
jgi:hypothetical protein